MIYQHNPLSETEKEEEEKTAEWSIIIPILMLIGWLHTSYLTQIPQMRSVDNHWISAMCRNFRLLYIRCCSMNSVHTYVISWCECAWRRTCWREDPRSVVILPPPGAIWDRTGVQTLSRVPPRLKCESEHVFCQVSFVIWITFFWGWRWLLARGSGDPRPWPQPGNFPMCKALGRDPGYIGLWTQNFLDPSLQ